MTLTSVRLKEIKERAKTRKDGVYTYDGVRYRVINHFPKYLAHGGAYWQVIGNMVTCIGNYKYGTDTMKALRGI